MTIYLHGMRYDKRKEATHLDRSIPLSALNIQKVDMPVFQNKYDRIRRDVHQLETLGLQAANIRNLFDI